jgi:acetoin utilization protein AcuB
MRLVEIMSKDVKTAAAAMPAREAWDVMRAANIHHLVVTDGKKIVGIVSDRDLGGARGAALRDKRAVADVMTPNAITARPDTTVKQAANLLRGHVIGCLPVVDGAKLVGIVTTTDLLDLVGKGLAKPDGPSLTFRGTKRATERRQTPKARRERGRR